MIERKEFYTTQDLADFLQLNQRTIQKWIKEGKLKGYRFGKKYRIRSIDIENFLEEYKRVVVE